MSVCMYECACQCSLTYPLSLSLPIIHRCDSTDTVVGEILDRISAGEDEGAEINLHDVDQAFRMLGRPHSHFIYVRMRVCVCLCVCVYMSVSTLGDGILCDPFVCSLRMRIRTTLSILVVYVLVGV